MQKITITALFLGFFFNTYAQIKPFKSGDVAAFMGNSITHAGYYESYIWLYYMTHFPNEKITVYNAGSGGDAVGQMNDRFEDDVVRLGANIAVLTFGMNDSGYFGTEDPKVNEKNINESYKNFGLLQQKFKNHPEITPIIMTSSPYDETQVAKDNIFKGKSKVMEEIVDFQKKAAIANGWGYVDLFHPMNAINFEHQKSDSTFSILGDGRIHPGKGGHLLMAALFLKNQGLAGKPVAKVIIDSKKGKIVTSENAKTNIHSISNASVSFDYLANSLPFPIDSFSTDGNQQTQADILKTYPFTKEFNSEIIQVTGLKAGNYNLKIDHEWIGEFSAKSLNDGINMATMGNTPQYRQAKAIMKLNELRTKIEGKLREYYWVQFNYFREKGLLFDDSQKAYDLAKAEKEGFVGSKMGIYETARFPEVRKMYENDMDVLVSKIYEINKPVTRKIEVLPAL